MAAYLKLCDGEQVHSLPWLSGFLSVIIIIVTIIAPVSETLPCVLHRGKHFTNVIIC